MCVYVCLCVCFFVCWLLLEPLVLALFWVVDGRWWRRSSTLMLEHPCILVARVPFFFFVLLLHVACRRLNKARVNAWYLEEFAVETFRFCTLLATLWNSTFLFRMLKLQHVEDSNIFQFQTSFYDVMDFGGQGAHDLQFQFGALRRDADHLWVGTGRRLDPGFWHWCALAEALMVQMCDAVPRNRW